MRNKIGNSRKQNSKIKSVNLSPDVQKTFDAVKVIMYSF